MKALFLTIFTFVSLGVLANDLDSKVSEETILKVNNSSQKTILDPFGSGGCSWASGTVSCGDGNSRNIWTSTYNDWSQTIDALWNNATNFCGGGDFMIQWVQVNQVPCL